MNPAETQWSYDTMAPTPKLQYVIRDKVRHRVGFLLGARRGQGGLLEVMEPE
jgi:hypothetical protein